MTNGIASMFGCSKKEIYKQLSVEKLFCYQPKRRKVYDLCIGVVVYVQEHVKDLVSRDTGLKNYHYTGNIHSSRMAVVISIDEACNRIKVKYCSLGTNLVVDRQNVLKADNVAKDSF